MEDIDCWEHGEETENREIVEEYEGVLGHIEVPCPLLDLLGEEGSRDKCEKKHHSFLLATEKHETEVCTLFHYTSFKNVPDWEKGPA